MSERVGYWLWLGKLIAYPITSFLERFKAPTEPWECRFCLRDVIDNPIYEATLGLTSFLVSVSVDLAAPFSNATMEDILICGAATVLTFLLMTHGFYRREVDC